MKNGRWEHMQEQAMNLLRLKMAMTKEFRRDYLNMDCM
jgi:hypothetical protein